MPQFELLFTQDFANANTEIEQSDGRVTQQFSDSVFEAMVPESPAAKRFDLASLKYSSTVPGFALDETSQRMTNAWRKLQNKERSDGSDAVERLLPNAGHSHKPGFRAQIAQVFTSAWRKLQSKERSGNFDGVERLPPNSDHSFKLGAFRAQVKPPATSKKMRGSVLMSAVIVSGPGDLAFDQDEVDIISGNVMWACRYLASFADPETKLRFFRVDAPVTITAPSEACTNVADCERVWREPVLSWFSQGRRVPFKTVAEVVQWYQKGSGADYAYIIFFHKYPQVITPAYTAVDNANNGLGYACLKYEYWWKVHYGTVLTLTKVVAHETCHVFGAADEYNIPLPNGGIQKCSCAGSGASDVPNKNCVECTPQHVACMMDVGPELNLCNWSRGQIGWNYWNEVDGAPTSLIDISVPDDLTIFCVDSSNVVWMWSYMIGGGFKKLNVKGNVPSLVKVSAAPNFKGGDVPYHLWGLGTNGRPYRYDSQSSTWEPQSAVLNFWHISVASYDEKQWAMWATDPNGYISRYSGSGTERSDWTTFGGQYLGVSVGMEQAGTIVWAIGQNHKIGTFLDDAFTFDIVNGQMDSIDLRRDMGWGTSKGEVHRYLNASNKWQLIHGAPTFGGIAKVANGGDGHVYALTGAGKLVRHIVATN